MTDKQTPAQKAVATRKRKAEMREQRDAAREQIAKWLTARVNTLDECDRPFMAQFTNQTMQTAFMDID